MAAQGKEEISMDSEKIASLLDSGDLDTLTSLLSSSHPADVANLLNSLSNEDARKVFDILSPKDASEVIVELNDEAKELIIEEMESARVGEIVDHMASDDAADLLGVLSEDDAKKVLEHVSEEDTAQVRRLLSFEEDSAGGIMQAEFASVVSTATVQEVIAILREMKDEYEDIHNIFVTDRSHVLIGLLPVRKLVLESPQTVMGAIMETDFVTAHVDQDQEEIARIFKKYDLISIPVTDESGRLVGRITIDDIVDVMEEEASEDIFKMAGAVSEDILSMSTIKSAKTRLPWLFASCIGGIIGLRIIGFYEHNLGKFVALAAFLPVILGMGGNIGTQSTTIVVRGLAIGSVDVSTLWRIVAKEVRIGFIMGLTYGLLLAAATSLIYPANPKLSIVVGFSMCASMVVASAVGTLMPLFLFKLGTDPAIATGPFVTTTIDIIGILILFNFAAFFLF